MTKAVVFYDTRDANSLAAGAILKNKYRDINLFDTSGYAVPGNLATDIAALDNDYDEAWITVPDTNADFVAEVLGTADITIVDAGAGGGEIVTIEIIPAPAPATERVTIGHAVSGVGTTEAQLAAMLEESINEGTSFHGFTASIDVGTPTVVNLEAPSGTGVSSNVYVTTVVLVGATIDATVLGTDWIDNATGVNLVPYNQGEIHVTELAAITAIATTVERVWDSGAKWTAERTWDAAYPTVMPPRALLFLSFNVEASLLGFSTAFMEVIENFLSNIDNTELAWRKLLDYYGDANNPDKHQTIQDLDFLFLMTGQKINDELSRPMRLKTEK